MEISKESIEEKYEKLKELREKIPNNEKLKGLEEELNNTVKNLKEYGFYNDDITDSDFDFLEKIHFNIYNLDYDLLSDVEKDIKFNLDNINFINDELDNLYSTLNKNLTR